MRRIDLINSVIKIDKMIKIHGLEQIFINSLNKPEIDDSENNALTFQKLSNHFLLLNETDRKVLSILGLSGIESAKLWVRLITGKDDGERDTIIQYYRALNFVGNYLLNFVKLLQQDNIEYTEHNGYITINSQVSDSQEILTVILPETGKEISNPDRLIKILNSINLFYETVSEITGHEGKDLSIIAIDSGSDKSFDFLGAAKVVTSVKELIISLWDRVVFHREKKLSEKIDLIAKALPVIESINELEKDKKIGPEQAEILRRNIFNGAKDFLLVGAVLPEFNNYSSYNPRQLMAPEPKMLNVGTDRDTRDSNQSVIDDITDNESPEDDLSPAERQLLNSLIKRESKKKKGRL